MRKFDEEIASFVEDVKPLNCNPDEHKIAFLATALYDMGGHSKCVRDIIKSLDGIYEQKLFLTEENETYKKAPNTVSVIKKHAKIAGLNSNLFKLKESAEKSANTIIKYAPKTIIVYINPDDIIGTAVLSILKRTTNIKILYFDHASHFPALGMTFADCILNGMQSSIITSHEKRHLYNTKLVGLQSLPKDETIYYPKEELQKLKKEMGIPENSLVTMSGGSAYKFFDKNSNSEYFEMIKRLLQKEKNLYHVVIVELNKKYKEKIDEIFKDFKAEKKRLIILPFQNDIDKYFQCADVFIDSFPISSALTQVDLMRNKVASVVKINRENPEYSFHEYQMPNYPYMFESVNDMENAITELLHSSEKRKEIIENNYEFWLKTYESNVFRDKIVSIAQKD